eukprot:357008-Chlamydomonas_euryale.AAC.8
MLQACLLARAKRTQHQQRRSGRLAGAARITRSLPRFFLVQSRRGGWVRAVSCKQRRMRRGCWHSHDIGHSHGGLWSGRTTSLARIPAADASAAALPLPLPPPQRGVATAGGGGPLPAGYAAARHLVSRRHARRAKPHSFGASRRGGRPKQQARDSAPAPPPPPPPPPSRARALSPVSWPARTERDPLSRACGPLGRDAATSSDEGKTRASALAWRPMAAPAAADGRPLLDGNRVEA